MSWDWKPGDLAMCVSIRLAHRPLPSEILKVGRIYTVNDVRWSDKEQCLALGLDEARSRGKDGMWHAILFRKIDPLTDEERDSFLADLKMPAPLVEA